MRPQRVIRCHVTWSIVASILLLCVLAPSSTCATPAADATSRTVQFLAGGTHARMSALHGVALRQSDSGGIDCSVHIAGNKLQYTFCGTIDGNIQLYYNLSSSVIDLTFVMQSPGGVGWIALGFCEEQDTMVGSNAVIAYPTGSSSSVELGDYYLGAESTQGVQVGNRQKLEALTGAFDPATSNIVVTLRRALQVHGLRPVDVTAANMLWASGPGPVASPKEVREHHKYGSVTVNLTAADGGNLGSSDDENQAAYVAHAVLMGVAWVLLAPTAVLIARFMKFKDPLWFQLHRGIQIFVCIIVIVAFAIGLAYGPHEEIAHLSIGCIVVAMMLLQLINGILRPDKLASSRRFWYHVHSWTGRITLLLAIINVFIGIDIMGGGIGWYIATGAVFGLLMCVHVGLDIYFKYNGIEYRPAASQKEQLAEESPSSDSP